MNADSVREDTELEERTKLLFEEGVSGLDAETRSKLTRARYRALEELGTRSASARSPRWIPAGALVAAVLVTMVLWQDQPPVSPEAQTFDVAALSDLEILLGEEELDMIQELEFFAWLDEQAESVPADSAEGGVG